MEDVLLIDRYLTGDEEGFTMLVKKYQNRVINIVYSLTGKTGDADDIAQEVFIKVYRNLSSFKKRSGFSTWLYRITVNTTYNHLKKQKRHLPLGYAQEPAALTKSSLEELESSERQELISEALGKLPFKFRTAIVLKEIEGLSYKDIAGTLGCRIGTVESRLFRARQMLKEILSPIIKEG
jgi:RNA polymerase sigma-70 factor (ECF subfamily)